MKAPQLMVHVHDARFSRDEDSTYAQQTVLYLHTAYNRVESPSRRRKKQKRLSALFLRLKASVDMIEVFRR
jgi:hypothetical protein